MSENTAPLPPLICDICHVKDLSKCRDQPENIERHKVKCLQEQKKKESEKKWKRKSNIKNFFPTLQPKKKMMPALEVEEVAEVVEVEEVV